MPLSNAFGAPYPLVRDSAPGETVPIPLLTMEQIGTVIASLEAARNARIRRIAKEEKLDAEQTARFREMGEREEIEIPHLRLYARSVKGAAAILAVVLTPEILAALSLEERIEAAMGAIGWKPSPEKKDAPANPSSAGEASTGNATAG